MEEDDNNLQQCVPDDPQSPLFEPERVVRVAPEANMIPNLKTDCLDRLKAIEANTIAAITSWNPSTIGSVLPAKRSASEIWTDSDDDDGDSNDERDTAVPPLDLTQQRRPKLPIYHPGFQQSEKDVRSILRVFKDFLGAAADQGIGGEEAAYLHSQAVKNCIISYQEEIRFAVTGDTGSGKSATTNALLGDDLTPEGDSGSPCTNVVTEFRQKKLSNNMGAVQAEVKFYCLEYCIENLVNIWFNQWFNTQQRMMSDEEDVDDDDRARKDAALDCLNHLFAYYVAPESLEDFMSASKSWKDSPALLKLQRWTGEIHEQFVRDGELFVPLTSSTHSDMREQLRPFRMKAPNARFNGKPLSFSPWPFVEIIRYYVDSPLLQDGICLADVPGAKDINVYRVAAAEDYLQQCEKTIVVVDIKRATSDQSFRQHYLDAHRRRHHGSVILVATRSDEMNDDGGSTLQLDAIAEGQLAPVEEKLSELTGKVQIIENDIENNKNKIKRIRSFVNQSSVTEDNHSKEALRATNKDLVTRKKELKARIISLEKERKDIRIACRNRFVATGLNRMYSHNTGDDAGAASFCISNRMFMRYRRGYNTAYPDKVPSMKLEDTKILALFNHIAGQPSQGKVAVLENFIQFKTPMLLSIFQMSCSKSTEARVEYITKILDQAIKDIELEIEKMKKRCHSTFLEDLLNELSKHQLQDKFDSKAETKLEELEKMAAASHRALVRNQGKWHQKKLGIKHDVNAALLSFVASDIDRHFRRAIEDAPSSFKAHAAQTIKTSFRELNKLLKDDPQALVGDAYQTCFGNNVLDHEKNITLTIEAATKKLRDGLIEVFGKAIKPTEKEYMHRKMKPVYQQAILKKAGKRQKLMDVRHAYLKEKIIGLEGVFPDIAGLTREDVRKLISDTCNELCKEVVGILETIRDAFQRQKHSKEHDTPEGQHFRKELHELIAEALRILKGPVCESLERCKEYK
ncbi:hypothetical protein COCCADRAFT_4365 [Bipolaris zeicola 26-R-13]|uniref:G domain-containing protein n=1 Tax=Cochliobolus carbonum (strain 26-R-13) TaxID=930089 RepID=W6YRT8_COCC2|nr:uncharacterized protein COCCADRAFT_4365 [Bipolaris zeicola 26-R-13]EUC34221.1 hypothetical protein COCCADRAFT_4365 [Bipolaris zeicola 26-R-13]